MSRKAIKKWIPIIIWISLIFSLSSIPSLPLDYPESPVRFDKIAHFFEYLVLAVFLHRALDTNSTKKASVICFLIIVTGIGIAALDEFYQSYIPGRDSNFFDGLADVAGVIVGAVGRIIYVGKVKRVEKI